jgi:hypothetical protein
MLSGIIISKVVHSDLVIGSKVNGWSVVANSRYDEVCMRSKWGRKSKAV